MYCCDPHGTLEQKKEQLVANWNRSAGEGNLWYHLFPRPVDAAGNSSAVPEVCSACRKAGEVVLCDGYACARVYHPACVAGGVPDNDDPWLCPPCVSAGNRPATAADRKAVAVATHAAQFDRDGFVKIESGLLTEPQVAACYRASLSHFDDVMCVHRAPRRRRGPSQ